MCCHQVLTPSASRPQEVPAVLYSRRTAMNLTDFHQESHQDAQGTRFKHDISARREGSILEVLQADMGSTPEPNKRTVHPNSCRVH